TYQTTVNFGSGIVTAPTSVNLVNASSQTAFNNYFAASGVVGVLGIGPNNLFPGTSSVIPALPGTLNNGVLIDESHGVLEFGPNPLTTNVAVAGSPTANLQVKIGSAPVQTVPVSIDSGGVYGTIPSSMLPTGQTSIPSGTLISVYTSDGQTLLYSYTTGGANTPTVTSGGTMNTGFEPFLQNPVYISYSPSGYGTTVFDA
ncbi:MAG: PecA family PE domain-processing aspartic protease, partial [Mycobacterium sp.]